MNTRRSFLKSMLAAVAMAPVICRLAEKVSVAAVNYQLPTWGAVMHQTDWSDGEAVTRLLSDVEFCAWFRNNATP